MRATTVLLIVGVVASAAQAVKIRGSRRKYIVEKPIENLTPAQKEYFVRLLWLMKNLTGRPIPDLGSEDPEVRYKLAHGGFYYDDVSKNKENKVYYYRDTPGKEIQHNLESEHTSNNVHKEDENSLNNGNHGEPKESNSGIGNGNMSSPNENVIPSISPLRSQESNDIVAPYVIYGHESSSQSTNNESKDPYVVESISHSNENDIISPNVVQDHKIDGSSRSNEIQGPFIVNSGKYNSNSREIDSSGSNEFQRPYFINNNKRNRYRENYITDYENVSPSKSNELPGSYDNRYSSEIDDPSESNEHQGPNVIVNDNYNSYSRENEINNYEYNSPFKSNDQPGSNDEYNSYSSETDDSSGSNEFQPPYVINNEKHNSYSRENEINNYKNFSTSKSNEEPGSYDEYNSYSSEIDDPSESNEFQRPYVINNQKHDSYSREKEMNNYQNFSPSKSNVEPGSYDEYNSYSSETDDSTGSYEIQRPYVINNDKHNSNSRENDISDYKNVSSSKSNELPASYDEYNSNSSEIDASSGSNEFQRPYVINNEKHNSYSIENEINNNENFSPSKSNKLPGSYDKYNSYSREIDSSTVSNEFKRPYVINNDKNNGYSRENDIINHENVSPSKSNELPDTYDEYNSYSTETDDSSVSNEHPDAVDNDKYNSYSKVNDIKHYENDDNISESSLQSESRGIQRPYASRSEEDSDNSTDDFPEVILPPSEKNYNLPYNVNKRPNKPRSSEEDGPSYNELNPYVQQLESDENTFYDDDNQSNRIQESIEDVLAENNIYENNDKPHYENSLRHRKKTKPSSDLPQFIIKPDRSLETIRIIPAPRLTSLVIKMCDKSETNILDVWKKVAKRLGLDNDYTVSNIYEVEQLFKIISTFVSLSKNKNFLNMPLSKILATIRDDIGNESGDRSVEAYKTENNDDHYDSEENYSTENGSRELYDSPDFHVETSLEPVEIPSDLLSAFLKYIFENQEDPYVASDESDISDSLISDESDSRELKEFINKYNSEGLTPDLSTSDDLSNDRRIPDKSDFDSTELDSTDFLVNSEPNNSIWPYFPNSHESSADVLPISPSADISSSLEEQDSSISEENSYLPNFDDENGDNRPYSPNSDIVNEFSDISDSNERSAWPYLESTSESVSIENYPDDNISRPLPCPVITEEPISHVKKEPGSREDPDVSNDLLNNLIPYIMGTNVSKFIQPFMEKQGRCRNPIHKELLQKVKEIIELLQKAKCF